MFREDLSSCVWGKHFRRMLYVLIAIVLNDLKNCASDLLDVIQLGKKRNMSLMFCFIPKQHENVIQFAFLTKESTKDRTAALMFKSALQCALVRKHVWIFMYVVKSVYKYKNGLRNRLYNAAPYVSVFNMAVRCIHLWRWRRARLQASWEFFSLYFFFVLFACHASMPAVWLVTVTLCHNDSFPGQSKEKRP